MNSPVWAAGLMTGTVLDGYIDVALIRTDGERVVEFGPYDMIPYPDDINQLLFEAQRIALGWAFQGPEPAIFAQAEQKLSTAQAQAVLQVVEQNGMDIKELSAIGFHGQTVLHRAPVPGQLGATRQLGDGTLMAQITGTDVVYDLRSADMAAGGHGAPLAPIYHTALLDGIDAPTDWAMLNLGGVANVSWRAADGTIVGFDTGPANAPINDFMRERNLGEMDRNGELALKGTVDEALLRARLDLPYLNALYPKSLDRFDFRHDWVAGLSDADGAATLTAFSAAAVGKALDLLPSRPTRLIVSGGGRLNPVLMKELEQRAQVEVAPAETQGWRGDTIEAECFAFLAVRSLRSMPLSFPTTTGVPEPTQGGRIARAPA